MVCLISVRTCLAVGFMGWQGFAELPGMPGTPPHPNAAGSACSCRTCIPMMGSRKKEYVRKLGRTPVSAIERLRAASRLKSEAISAFVDHRGREPLVHRAR